MKRFFSPTSSVHIRSDAHQSQIIGVDADVDQTQTIGGDTVKLLGGDISPHPPWVSAPLLMYNYLRTSALNNQIDFVNKMLTKMRQRIFFIYKKKIASTFSFA